MGFRSDREIDVASESVIGRRAATINFVPATPSITSVKRLSPRASVHSTISSASSPHRNKLRLPSPSLSELPFAPRAQSGGRISAGASHSFSLQSIYSREYSRHFVPYTRQTYRVVAYNPKPWSQLATTLGSSPNPNSLLHEPRLQPKTRRQRAGQSPPPNLRLPRPYPRRRPQQPLRRLQNHERGSLHPQRSL